MNENEKMAKTIKILSVVLGIALIVVGAARALMQGDNLALGEDGLLGVSVCLLGYGLGAAIKKKEAVEEEEKSDDEGI